MCTPTAILSYLAHVVTDGDTANDYLTHCAEYAEPLAAFGRLVAYLIGV